MDRQISINSVIKINCAKQFLMYFVYTVITVYISKYVLKDVHLSLLSIEDLFVGIVGFTFLLVSGKKPLRRWLQKYKYIVLLLLTIFDCISFVLILNSPTSYFVASVVTVCLNITAHKAINNDINQVLFRGDERYQRNRYVSISELLGGGCASVFIIAYEPTLEWIIWATIISEAIVVSPISWYRFIITDRYMKQESIIPECYK